MPLPPRVISAICAIGFLAAADARASDKVAELSAQIAKDPGNVTLVIRRAHVQREKGDYQSALADLELAAGLPGGELTANLAAGEILVEMHNDAAALAKLELVLGSEPTNNSALVLKARALARLGRHDQAVTTYRKLFTLVPAAEPDLYLELANELGTGGPSGVDAALLVLDDGIKRLGPLITLERPALDFEVKRKRWDRALARVDVLVGVMPRKDTWLARRGEVLLAAGRMKEARAAFLAARAALDALPPGVRETPAIRELAADLERRAETARSGRPVKTAVRH